MRDSYQAGPMQATYLTRSHLHQLPPLKSIPEYTPHQPQYNYNLVSSPYSSFGPQTQSTGYGSVLSFVDPSESVSTGSQQVYRVSGPRLMDYIPPTGKRPRTAFAPVICGSYQTDVAALRGYMPQEQFAHVQYVNDNCMNIASQIPNSVLYRSLSFNAPHSVSTPGLTMSNMSYGHHAGSQAAVQTISPFATPPTSVNSFHPTPRTPSKRPGVGILGSLYNDDVQQGAQGDIATPPFDGSCDDPPKPCVSFAVRHLNLH